MPAEVVEHRDLDRQQRRHPVVERRRQQQELQGGELHADADRTHEVESEPPP
jgi:hypothetical protein